MLAASRGSQNRGEVVMADRQVRLLVRVAAPAGGGSFGVTGSKAGVKLEPLFPSIEGAPKGAPLAAVAPAKWHLATATDAAGGAWDACHQLMALGFDGGSKVE